MRVQTIVLREHLTVASLTAALEPVDVSGPSGLVVDARAMESYDTAARDHFVSWNAKHRKLISAVGIVTEKTLWHVVIAAMSLASRQKMKAFDKLEAAEAWVVATPSSPP